MNDMHFILSSKCLVWQESLLLESEIARQLELQEWKEKHDVELSRVRDLEERRRRQEEEVRRQKEQNEMARIKAKEENWKRLREEEMQRQRRQDEEARAKLEREERARCVVLLDSHQSVLWLGKVQMSVYV